MKSQDFSRRQFIKTVGATSVALGLPGLLNSCMGQSDRPYENAFANASVCAPARSTLATGMYASSLGTHHMRSKNPIPEYAKFYGNYFREAGYYCTNNSKEDYNVQSKPDGCWDESSKKATYRNRQPDQPFFAVFNHGVSHESSLHKMQPEL